MFAIDFTKPYLYKDVVYFHQGNLSTNNTLRCTLNTGGSNDLTGCNIMCTFKLQNSTEISGVGRIIDPLNAIVDLVFPSNALAVGLNKLEILVNRSDGSVAQSPSITYDIWQGLTTGNGIEAETNYPILIELINSTNEASNKANSALNKANSMITDITDAIDNAYRSANEADIATSNANAKIEEVETAKTEMIKKVDTSIVTMKSEVETAKNEMASKTDAKMQQVDRALAAGTKDLEVKEARRDMDGVEHATLKVRLESDLKKGKVIEETKEGTYLSFNDTVGGIVSDIEVLGNTVQDISNLANIRSSCIPNGDGTFKMSILSCGENLFGSKFELGTLDTTTGLPTPRDSRIRSVDYTRVNSNTNYCISDNLNYTWVIYEYDNSNKFVKLTVTTSAKKTITTSPTTRYIKIRTEDTQIDLNVKCKLQEGTVATPYAPYEETRCDIKLPCQLEKWDRLYFDKEENAWVIDKGIVKIMLGDIVPSIQSSQNGETTYYFSFDLMDKAYARDVFCNVLPFNTNTFTVGESESVCVNGGLNALMGRVKSDKVGAYTKEAIQSYLKKVGAYALVSTINPQKIVLPQSEQIKLNSFANKTHIYTISGELDATVKATVSKSLASTVQANTNEINILSDKIEDIQGLKESQDFAYETDKGYLVCKDTQNGVVKDLKIYGKSLVNLFNVNTMPISNTVKTSDSYFKLTNVNTNYDAVIQKNIIGFKPNTDYTFVFDIKTYTLNKAVNITGSSSTPFIKNGGLVQGEIGVKAIKLTTKSDLTGIVYDLAISHNITDATGDFECRMMILEGDHTQNPPQYFEGIASVGNGNGIEVLSSNKNLANVTIVENKTWSTNGIQNDMEGQNAISEMIEVIPNVNYMLSCNSVLGVGNIRFFDKDKKYINQVFNGKFQTPNNCKFIAWFASNKDLPKDSKILLELGDKITNYINPKQDKKTILFKDTDNTWKPVTELKGIDIYKCDTIEQHSDGKHYLHIRTNKKVLNGSDTENWGTIGGIQNQVNTIAFALTIDDGKDCPINNLNIINDRFPCTPNSSESHIDKELLAPINTNIMVACVRILKTKLETQDTKGFKKWLQNNPITIVYELSKEKIYEINPLFPQSFDKETMISFGSGAIAPHASWKITSNLVGVLGNVKDRVKRMENDFYKYTVTQNRMQLGTTYSSDRTTFRVDTATFSTEKAKQDLDYDLFRLLKHNILVGPHNYDKAEMENMMDFYVSVGKIDYNMWDELYMLIEEQHNPPVEEEAPVI